MVNTYIVINAIHICRKNNILHEIVENDQSTSVLVTAYLLSVLIQFPPPSLFLSGPCKKLIKLMDHYPFRQTFELGIFISTAEKSILNLVKLRSLVAKHCKMGKISKCDYTFPRPIQKYTKFTNSTALYFSKFAMFCN